MKIEALLAYQNLINPLYKIALQLNQVSNWLGREHRQIANSINDIIFFGSLSKMDGGLYLPSIEQLGSVEQIRNKTIGTLNSIKVKLHTLIMEGERLVYQSEQATREIRRIGLEIENMPVKYFIFAEEAAEYLTQTIDETRKSLNIGLVSICNLLYINSHSSVYGTFDEIEKEVDNLENIIGKLQRDSEKYMEQIICHRLVVDMVMYSNKSAA